MEFDKRKYFSQKGTHLITFSSDKLHLCLNLGQQSLWHASSDISQYKLLDLLRLDVDDLGPHLGPELTQGSHACFSGKANILAPLLTDILYIKICAAFIKMKGRALDSGVGRKRGDQNESRLQHAGPFCNRSKPALPGAPVRFLGFINQSSEGP